MRTQVARASSIDTVRWITLRWTRGTRYLRVHLEQDLWDHAPLPLTVTGFGALAVNLSCAFLLVRFRHHKGSLTRAAFLSARNDALADLAIIGAGLVTLAFPSAWPDVLVGMGIAYMNVDAAKEVWAAARSEHRAAIDS